MYVVAPAYNESESIPHFISAVCSVAEESCLGDRVRVHLVVVDDGSTDKTYEAIQQGARNPTPSFCVTGIGLSRNFGQQAAIQSGLEWAYERSVEGDLFAVMDSDLQHPPELLSGIVDELRAGADHVQMVRREPESLSWPKRASSAGFYWILRRMSDVALPEGGSDFRGLSRRFLGAYLSLRERGRFNRGLFYWVGFPRKEIAYQARERTSGVTKYNWTKMLSFATTAMVQFSSRPLILLCSIIVAGSFTVCAGYLGFELVRWMGGRQFVLGWPTVIFFISLWSGAIALSQLLLALYVGRIFDEVKGRPVYLVRRVCEPGAENRDASLELER